MESTKFKLDSITECIKYNEQNNCFHYIKYHQDGDYYLVTGYQIKRLIEDNKLIDEYNETYNHVKNCEDIFIPRNYEILKKTNTKNNNHITSVIDIINISDLIIEIKDYIGADCWEIYIRNMTHVITKSYYNSRQYNATINQYYSKINEDINKLKEVIHRGSQSNTGNNFDTIARLQKNMEIIKKMNDENENRSKWYCKKYILEQLDYLFINGEPNGHELCIIMGCKNFMDVFIKPINKTQYVINIIYYNNSYGELVNIKK